ncbi:hypothetical protein C8Q75DRAFT_890971 [Abortiporus biennis]|nr:hypothetical protein C8Q75DRAFT_890971 [Abortiporus biennis]
MIPACNYNIPMEYVKGYCQARPDDNRHRKRESCIWLSKILDHLHNALPDNPSNEARFINVADRVVVDGYPNLKPDFLRREKEDLDNEHHWEDMTGFAEVKHECKLDLPPGQDGPTLEINLSYLSDKEQAVEVYEEPASPTIPAKRKRVNTPAPGSTKSNKRRKNQDGSATSRESTHYSTPAMSGEGIFKTTVTRDEVQVVKYANELQSHGVRNYPTGIFFDNQWISLWYIDSMGIVKSQPFMFPHQPHYLLLVVAAMKAASLRRLGVSPFIDYSHPEAKFGSYEHTFLQLPEAEDEEGSHLSDPAKLRFPIDVQENRRLLNTHGAIGRATTVVPILPPQLSATSSMPSESCANISEEYLVAKVSWPDERRNSEAGYIRAIRKKMKEHPDAKHYAKNIVKVKYSLTLKRDAEQLLFPRGLVGFEDPSELRVLRLLVLVCYEPLEKVISVEEFKKVFRDVVIAHHWVFSVGKILHRDLSTTNLMIQRIGPEINGILTDFDLAVSESKEEQDEEVGRLSEGLALDTTPPSPLPGPTTSLDVSDVKEKAHTDNISQNMRFRTGPGPFMAIDVLDLTPTPIRIYRYDLESFFYVLVWFCAGFNPEMNTLSSIDDWRTPPFKTIAANKQSFVNTNETRNAILAPTHSTYKPIIDLWISPLRKIFQGIESTTLSISQKKGEVMDLDDKFQQGLAMLDQLTLEAKEALLVTKTEIKELEAEVQHLEAERDDLCTYDKFMAILHDKPRTVSELRDDANRDITEDELDMMLLKLRSELESEKDEA